MLIKSSLGKTISTIDDWEAYSPPAEKKTQWVDGRSAKELAKLWMRKRSGQIPEELSWLFSCVSEFDYLDITLAIPECKTKIDQFGTSRVHDLLLYGKSGNDKVVISVEAKVDELFGPTIKERKKNNRAHSNIDKRIAQLSQALFYQKNVDHLCYQLLHDIGSTLIEAKRHHAAYAVFVVHDFITSSLDPDKILQNDEDLNEFVSCLTNKPTMLEYGTLHGPFYVPGGDNISRDIPIFIGKIQTYCPIKTEKRYKKRAVRM
jgi:hypothetical protein